MRTTVAATRANQNQPTVIGVGERAASDHARHTEKRRGGEIASPFFSGAASSVATNGATGLARGFTLLLFIALVAKDGFAAQANLVAFDRENLH